MRMMTVVLMALCAGIAHAEDAAAPAEAAAPPAEPACKTAEINPVTGHTFCIDPLGAAVEAPPPDDAAPCKPDQREGEAWTWGPTCSETPEGM